MRATLLTPILLTFALVAAAEPSKLDGVKLTVTVGDANRSTAFSLPVSASVPTEGTWVATGNGKVAAQMTVIGDRVYGVVPKGTAPGDYALTINRMSNSAGPSVSLKESSDSAIEVRLNDQPFTTYHYKKDDRKPYLWPVFGENRAPMTREWAITGKQNKSKDHPHHVSFWSAHGNVNGADFWEYGERTGWQVADKVESGSGYAAGWIASHDTWVDKDKKPVVAEDRTYIFYNTPEPERLMDVTVVFTAKYGDVKFGDTKEGGIVAFRMNDDLRELGGTGKITTSEGAVGEKAAWGKPAAWCDYSGKLEGIGDRGIAVMDSPQSFRYPVHWHVRNYGLMGANPFGYSAFTNGKEHGEYTLPKGQSISFSYRIYIHSGDVTAADVAGHYKDFSNPAIAKWVK